MTYKTILVETHKQVGLIRLNRPKVLNALNDTLLKELAGALEAFDADDAVGAIVITGNEKAFAAGADIKEMADASAVEMHKSDFIPSFDRIRGIKKPVIAAVSGWALGGGSELALSCDMIVASETAKFGQPEINIGVIPGAGGTQRLAKAVGKAIAMEMILNNRTLSADEGQTYGLVNRVVPVENYLNEALALAAEIATRAPLAIQFGKEAVNQAFETSLTEGLADERRAFNFLFATEDQKEGMAAFVEKRDPRWKGR
ncbi:MAG: enoyl-CoA hydratase/isomerase family protein [Anaerolineales bacterium]|nr:enoyl-CoA hydratase/isomerase family protein [Chloroflexota bacterium]MBL6980654.1 enoyl-CoA hydratase/isomerase family protein [Anaerolineales bacterium]